MGDVDGVFQFPIKTDHIKRRQILKEIQERTLLRMYRCKRVYMVLNYKQDCTRRKQVYSDTFLNIGLNIMCVYFLQSIKECIWY